jgi:hypothetical protein
MPLLLSKGIKNIELITLPKVVMDFRIQEIGYLSLNKLTIPYQQRLQKHYQ